jgi:hypothetical protein
MIKKFRFTRYIYSSIVAKSEERELGRDQEARGARSRVSQKIMIKAEDVA